MSKILKKARFKPSMAALLAFLMAFGALHGSVFAAGVVQASPIISLPPHVIYGDACDDDCGNDCDDGDSGDYTEPVMVQLLGEWLEVPDEGIIQVEINGHHMDFAMPLYAYIYGERVCASDPRVTITTAIFPPGFGDANNAGGAVTFGDNIGIGISPFSAQPTGATITTITESNFRADASVVMRRNNVTYAVRVPNMVPVPDVWVCNSTGQSFSSPFYSIPPPECCGDGFMIYEYEQDGYVYETRTGQRVNLISSLRYQVNLGGVQYEAFCADPNLPGPESAATAYGLSGSAPAALATILRYGFPSNPMLSDDGIFNSYATRVAIAYVSRPNADFFLSTSTAASALTTPLVLGQGTFGTAVGNRVNPPQTQRDALSAYPAITIHVAGQPYGADRSHADNDLGERGEDMVQSNQFVLRHNQRTLCNRNPFRFTWDADTPDDTRLYVNNVYRGTAPGAVSTVFFTAGSTTRGNPGSGWVQANNFHLRVPNPGDGTTVEAGVSIAGIHNANTGAWVMQHTTQPNLFQDLVFYIPFVTASALVTFDANEPDYDMGSLRIIKRSQVTNQGLAGAVFRVTGPDGFDQTFTTPASGEITPDVIGPLDPGEYTIEEITPPAGYQLSSPTSQTVTIVAGATTPVTVEFVNPPVDDNGNGNGNGNGGNGPAPIEIETRVFIEKVDALSRENIPNATHPGSGALIRLIGMSNHTVVLPDGAYWTFDNTGINLSQVLRADAQVATPGDPGVTSTVGDGWWELEGLPFGMYLVIEERAPDGFSLLPQHTAYAFWPNPPSISITIEDPPEGEDEAQVVLPWDEFVEMLQNMAGIDISEDMDLGAILAAFADILGELDLQVVLPPSMTNPSFEIEEGPNVNAVHIIFENYPFSEIVVYKHCIITNQPLADAHIRIQGFFVEGNAPQITDQTLVTDSAGRIVFQGLPAGQYTISEVQPPPGFLLDDPGFRSVSVSWGQLDGHPTRPAPVVRFYNTPMSYLEVLKIDGDTAGGTSGGSPTAGQPLAGAIFRLTGLDSQGNRTPWYATSGANGIARFDGPFIPGETYLLEEIQSPSGFVLMEGESAIIMTPGLNTVTWRNWRNPGLTIIKQDQDTAERLAGAEFTIVAQGSGNPLPIDFPLVTGADGTIHIPWTLFEGETERTFLVTEVVPPPGWHLADPNWQVVTMIAGYDNTVLFQNRRMPTITVDKRDSVTFEPIEGAYFHIEKIDDPGRGPLTGNPFRTNAAGQIVLPFQHAGMYRITEVQAALNYWLDPMEQNRSWIIHVRPNEDYVLLVENTLLPTLVVTKWNMLTMRPVPLTHFRIEHEVPNSPNVVHIGDFVTDSNGQIILPFVPVGWYRVTEIFPAPGMALNLNNNYRVFLSPGDNTYRLLNYIRGNPSGPNPSDAGVGPIDTDPDPDDTNPNPNPALPYPVQTVSSPEFPFTPAEWEAMNYSARQLFLQSQISVSSGDQWLAPGGQNVWNWPLNSIVIKKTCSVTGQLLPGATFNLIHTSAGASGTLGTVVGTYTTGSSGIIVITGLVPGSYVVREEIPPQHFTLSVNNTQTAFLAPDGHSVIELNFANDPFGSLLITKRCEVTHRPLQHAEFRVTRSDGSVAGTSNGLFTTNAQGYILIPNLPPDSYVVTELRAPDGFQIDRVPQTIRVNATGNTYSLHFTNIPYSTLIIRKLDSYNMTPLSGARFDVRFANGEWIGEFVTDSNGLIEIQGILGWVTITETDPPAGFALDPNPTRTVQVGPRAPSVVTFLNPRLGSLTIEKTDVHGAPLAGAQFRVNHQNGQHVGYFTTGASGMINISDLPSGWFFVEETRAPSGFVISEAGRSVEVATNSVAHVTFVNLEQPTLSIVKVDENGNPLAGARFRVSEIGGSFREYVTTGAGGVASLVLPVGSAGGSSGGGSGSSSSGSAGSSAVFEIVEVQAPAGFIITEPARTIIARAGEHRTETFVNHRIPSIVIEKVDTEGRPLQGAEFEIRRLDGRLVQRVVTNSGGVATIAQIEPGTFQVIESRAPQGFVADSTAQIVTVVAGQTATLRFVNERIPSLTIEKTCEDGLPLAGAVFEIRTIHGALIAEVTTNSGGIAIVAELPPGVYEIIETRAPAGFMITERSRIIEVFAGQTRRERFVNHRIPGIIIEKVDMDGNPLGNAEFEIRTMAGALVARVVTSNNGVAVVPQIDAGTFQVLETRAPDGFVLDSVAQFVTVSPGETATLRFVNRRMPALIIEKVDENGVFLDGAEFEVRRLNGELVHRVVTGNGGLAIIDELAPGAYQLIETRPPDGFAIVEPSRAIQIVAGETRVERFVNPRLATFVISKIDGVTSRPLQGVVFEITTLEGEHIRNPVNGSFEFVTDSAGLIRLPELPAGSYVATETRPLPGFRAAQPVIFVVGHDRDYVITVRNYRYPDINIRKLCGHTLTPQEGVQFEIRRFFADGSLGERMRNPLDGGFVWTTDNAGLIRIPNLPHGTYVATETRALPGFRLADPVVFVVDDHEPTTLTIHNYRFSEWNIRKISGDTGQPLQGVVFEVARFFGSGTTGDRIRNSLDGSFEFVSDAAGIARIGILEPGVYIITETRPLPGYAAADPVIITVESGVVDTTVTIRNYKLPTYVIRKICGDTSRPLQGVIFEVAHYFGNGNSGERIRNPVNGSFEFVTDAAGLIHLPNLSHGTFVIIETRPLVGFIQADPVIFVVGDNQDTTITIRNYRAPNLTIRKINSVTRQPIQGVVFQIAHISGERVINPATGFFDFVTDRNGLIYLPAMDDGTFLVTEVRPAPGYFGLDEPVVVHINSQTRQREHLLVVENTPASGLLIIKRCANTNAPLQGVEFEVRHADGRLVRGLMADRNQPGTIANSPNIAPNGNFLTDHRGMIHLNHLEAGVFHVTEVRALPGFLLDSTVHVVTITPGRLTTLEVTNEQKAGLRIFKIDSVTREGIQGVEFRIFDFITNQEVAGPFITDNRGVIEFTGILPAGRYTIRETREAPGFLRDTMPRTIELRAGMMTEVVWENTREAGQIQITKLSSADNQVNGLPAGSRLEGAVFEVRCWRTGNVIDQFITDARGVGVSRPLPLGRYLIEEIVAPAFYRRSDVILDVTIEHSGQILRFEFFNEPANVGVEVRKTGPVEVMPGQPIVWNITTIANSSTIELSDFFVRDVLPAHAVRLNKIFTGTFNQTLRYSVLFRTNLDDNWRVAYDNLLSTTNNALNMSPAALGLRSNEFVTEIMYSFGTVRAGFRSVIAPRIEGTVRDGLQNGYEFVNRIDAGGRTGQEWVVGNQVWVSRVWRPSHGQHPRTGW